MTLKPPFPTQALAALQAVRPAREEDGPASRVRASRAVAGVGAGGGARGERHMDRRSSDPRVRLAVERRPRGTRRPAPAWNSTLQRHFNLRYFERSRRLGLLTFDPPSLLGGPRSRVSNFGRDDPAHCLSSPQVLLVNAFAKEWAAGQDHLAWGTSQVSLQRE